MVEESKRKVLITGIHGMLGADLVLQLGNDYDVCGIDIDGAKGCFDNFVKSDITDKFRLEEVFDFLKPEIVIHLAAYTDVDGAEKNPVFAQLVNGKGTENIVFCCEKFKAKCLYISTDYVFDGKKHQPYTIKDSSCPINAYGKSKLFGEQCILRSSIDSVIVRTSWLFGGNGNNFVKTIFNRRFQTEPLYVVDDQRGSPTYTLSLAKGIENLLSCVFFADKPSSNYGLYHISNSGDCTWFELAKEIIDFSSGSVKVNPVDSNYSKRLALRPKYSVMDTSRYYDVTGIKICSWRDALKKYLQHEKRIN